jgi:biotin transport system substrate-specific component
MQPTSATSVSLARPLSWPLTVALVVAGSLLLTLSAKISVPFWPVPMTMQPLAVLMIGMLGGARMGVATVLLYLAEGAVGLPVFTGTPEKGIGLAYMAGPTGGYLGGFLLAAGVTGTLADRGWTRSILCSGLVALAGMACIYGLGVTWLTQLFGFTKAVTIGFGPFVYGDLLKIILAAVAVPALTAVIAKR